MLIHSNLPRSNDEVATHLNIWFLQMVKLRGHFAFFFIRRAGSCVWLVGQIDSRPKRI